MKGDENEDLPRGMKGPTGKESACNAGDLGLIPGLGRSPGEGKGYPLQYSGLENTMDRIVRGVAKSRTRLNDFQFSLFHLTMSLLAPPTATISPVHCRRDLTFGVWERFLSNLYPSESASHWLLWWISVKKKDCNAGDTGLIPGWGRYPGE